MGMGKTRTAASCIRRLLSSINPSAKVLWLTHREELIEQSKQELEDFTGQPCEVEQADHRSTGMADIVVGSVATLRGKRLQKLAEDFQPDLIVCDEAHHALALSWMQIKQTFPKARILNLTATPYRSDIANRIDLGTVLIEKNTTDGIRMGVLVPPRPVGKLELNLGNVKKRLGDYDTESLSELLCHPNVLRSSVRLLEEHARELEFSFEERCHVHLIQVAFHQDASRAEIALPHRPKLALHASLCARGPALLENFLQLHIAQVKKMPE